MARDQVGDGRTFVVTGAIPYTLPRMAQLPGFVAAIVQAIWERLPGLLGRIAHRIRTDVPVYDDVVDVSAQDEPVSSSSRKMKDS